jgi:hypothetical protein
MNDELGERIKSQYEHRTRFLYPGERIPLYV